jgi:hypothetical protein
VDEVPLGVVTVMSYVLAARAGATAMIELSDSRVNDSAAVLPKFTALAPVKWLPLTATTVPPAALPEEGVTAVTEGAVAALKV